VLTPLQEDALYYLTIEIISYTFSTISTRTNALPYLVKEAKCRRMP